MEGLPDSIALLSVADGSTIDAAVVPLTRGLAQTRIDSRWWRLRGISAAARKNEDDHSWQWAKRIGQLRNEKWYEAVAVQTPESDVQGAMVYRLDAKSFVDGSLGAVSIEALATAPRNRPELVQNPLYRGVGSGLLLRAVCHSYMLGFGGRINLLAFDRPKTVEFYQRRGFQIVPLDEEGPSLEITPERAVVWLRREGYAI
jgi:GNAT superfamily N-acetyltransferase